jgi:hypothetical protein
MPIRFCQIDTGFVGFRHPLSQSVEPQPNVARRFFLRQAAHGQKDTEKRLPLTFAQTKSELSAY